ncbi:hypothetical protein [Parenemella sanctibonifatiensis]|uniref:Uncharacterized protein n=1 Tax=Parenemella sanctibonifatiensis TaxID=2016505 RepID=A0A255EL00_9ACTN|nr:hypothetical protein [Parenemella sanctibonifatiensis]OYN92207.1 hypothetical protein CGZ91_01475 [Parenemella sanctibonifatiensis]
MTATNRRYLIRFAIGMAAYAITLPLAMWLLSVLGDSPWRPAAMLLVLPSLVLIVRAVWSYVREADERESRQVVESLAIGFAGGSMLTFSWGLFSQAGLPQLSIIWAMPVYMACWLIASLVVARRY